jgi:GNAT superfamily N-acetyltransferase
MYSQYDRKSCRKLWIELTDWHRQIYQDPSIGGLHPEDYFDKHLAKIGAKHLWVAATDQKVIGFGGLIVNDEEAEIEPLVVSKHYRNKGVGIKLVEALLLEARRLEIKYLSVKPVARNIEAIKFFYKRGFTKVGHIQLFIDFTNKQWKKGLKLFNCEFNF